MCGRVQAESLNVRQTESAVRAELKAEPDVLPMKPDNAGEEDTSDKMEVEVPVVNKEMDVDEGALRPGQPSGEADSNVITHQDLSDENNLNEEYTCIIEELNLPKASIEKYCKRLAELKEESNNIQYRVVWEAFHELIENDQLMESMAWLDDLDEPGDEDPIGLTLVDGSDDSIPLNRLQGLGKSDKVARMPVDQESDTGLTDTEEEDNDSLETQTEADDDDKKPRAKPVAATKKRIIPKAPRKVPVNPLSARRCTFQRLVKMAFLRCRFQRFVCNLHPSPKIQI